jgi:tetratricopeptide (TPR) repeat protein
MKKTLLLIAAICIQAISLFSQSNPLDKKMEKVYALVEKEKYKDATENLEKLLEDNPEFGKGWDFLSKLRYKDYEDSKLIDGLFSGKMTVTTKDKDGKKTDNDSMSNAIVDMISKISPSKRAYSKYIYTFRQALLTSDDAYHSSTILRQKKIDPETDTAVSKKALKYYNSAEGEFGKKNYEEAAKLYKRAIEEQPDFFKASLYMGDCFYFTGNYVNAAEAFRASVKTFPNLLEPRKYLIDTYGKQKLYDKCVEECIDAMFVYPDLSISEKMRDALYFLDKKLDFTWTPRAVMPNKIVDTTQSSLNEYKPEKPKTVNAPWTFYQKALDSMKPNCNTKGVITTPNKLSDAGYLEVYSWEEMLKNSTDPSLEQARKMQKDGFLDCYVLVTCFHYDFYDQYHDFVTKRKDKVMQYYKKYIVSK